MTKDFSDPELHLLAERVGSFALEHHDQSDGHDCREHEGDTECARNGSTDAPLGRGGMGRSGNVHRSRLSADSCRRALVYPRAQPVVGLRGMPARAKPCGQ